MGVSGGIDSVSKYAWGDTAGWINFGTSGGNVQVTDSLLTGSAWNENYGWINLAPQGSGVRNDGSGNLSGYAWGEKLGYINFEEVSINSSGLFIGTASISGGGTISFDCANCAVITSWRSVPQVTSFSPPSYYYATSSAEISSGSLVVAPLNPKLISPIIAQIQSSLQNITVSKDILLAKFDMGKLLDILKNLLLTIFQLLFRIK